jgi:hypothetical protein
MLDTGEFMNRIAVYSVATAAALFACLPGALAQHSTRVSKPSTTKPSTTPPPPPVMDEAFCRGAFTATKSAAGEMGLMDSVNGQLILPKGTSQLIDNLEFDARTPEEETLLTEITRFYMNRMLNNQERHMVVLRKKTKLLATYPAELAAIKADEEAEADPSVIHMNDQEQACAAALETSAKNFSFSGSAACDALAADVRDRIIKENQR